MALLKECKTVYGVTAQYWKVGGFTIDTYMQEVNFHFNLYVEKGAEKFIESYSITDLMGVDDKMLYNKYFAKDRGENYKDWQTACYEYAKTHIPFFKDAIDDPEESGIY